MHMLIELWFCRRRRGGALLGIAHLVARGSKVTWSSAFALQHKTCKPMLLSYAPLWSLGPCSQKAVACHQMAPQSPLLRVQHGFILCAPRCVALWAAVHHAIARPAA